MESVVISRRLRFLMAATGALFVAFGTVLAPYALSGVESLLSVLVGQGTMVVFGLVLFATALFCRGERERA